jgi:type I restriction enzyme, S subunit
MKDSNTKVTRETKEEKELRVLPEGWVWTTLGEIAESINPGFPSGKHNQENIGVPHLRPMNISREGKLVFSQLKSVEITNYPSLMSGDVLFNNTNSPELVGKTTYISKDTNWAYSNHMTRIRLNRVRANPAWVATSLHFLFVNGFFKLNCRHHINQASISSSYLSNNVDIPLPPLPEQERIVAKLEELLSDLDAGVAALERVSAGAKRYKASVLKAACEGKLFERNIVKRKESDLPHGWEWKSALDFCVAVECGSTPKAVLMNSEDCIVPFIKVYNLKFDGSLDFSIKPTFISSDTQKNLLKRSRVFPGDVLTNIVGPPLGKVSIVPEIYPEWNINQAIVLFRTNKTVDNKYLSYVLQSPDFKKRIKATAQATAGQYNVSLSTCRKIPMPIPPIVEQRQIVAEVEKRLESVRAVENAVETGLKRAKRLRQAVLKSAFEGRL